MSRLFPFSSPTDIDIRLDDTDDREQVEIEVDKYRKQSCPVYYDGDTVKGKVVIRSRDGREIRHDGIRVEFIGCIEMFYDRGNRYDFLSMSHELAAPGEIKGFHVFDFAFKNVEMPYESYHGINVKLRYIVRVILSKRLNPTIQERELWVHSYRTQFDNNNAIKMEVGIEDCLHIEFEYNKSKYHLKDVIVGKIFFLLVRIKIKHMELSIIRRETTGSPPNQYNESETITKFEIMDGAPLKGETIPIRLFLSGFELTPTYRDVNKKFSTRYYLNLVVIDEDNRRYFKQQEITIYRLDPSNDSFQSNTAATKAIETSASVPEPLASTTPNESLLSVDQTQPTPKYPKDAQSKKSTNDTAIPPQSSSQNPHLLNDQGAAAIDQASGNHSNTSSYMDQKEPQDLAFNNALSENKPYSDAINQTSGSIFENQQSHTSIFSDMSEQLGNLSVAQTPSDVKPLDSTSIPSSTYDPESGFSQYQQLFTSSNEFHNEWAD